ncbi:MAG: hypothetical protein COB10_04735 [Planctomycetota bacterium]|nr:MAG: hypothetical protein COB10_04735 [Planctomycetota bacterium]HIC23783.1 TlpA family protein disulfide reductase [Planctomycetota bacterium]
MYPHERSLVEKYNEHFTIVGVNSDRGRDRLKEAMAREEITWTSFYDGGGTGGPIATRWGVTGWPTLFLLDATGTIRHKGVRGEKLETAIVELLIEQGVELPADPREKEL